jgi:LysM repeat protein
MNRKDTILVAVLVNVGVLLILFISSLKPHSQQEWQAFKAEEQKEEINQIARIESSKTDIKSEAIPKEVTQVIDELFKGEAVEVAQTSTENTKQENLVAMEVKSGDVLGKLAKNSGSTVEEIKKINQLSDDRLQPGQTIYVPQNAPQKASAQSAKEKKPLSDDHYYTVKNGDNPWTIATKNHIKVEELLKLNGLDDAKAKKIKPGDRLRIK